MTKKEVSFKWAFKEFMWPRRKVLFLGLILILIKSASALITPHQSKVLIDNVVPFNDTEGLKMVLIIIFSALATQAITSFLLARLLSVEAQHLISLLRVKVQQKLLRLPVNFFDDNKSGALVARVMTDVEGVRNLVGTGYVQLIGGGITAIGALVLLLKINVMMTLSILIPLILLTLVILKAYGFIRPIFRDRGKINAEVTGRLTETFGGIRVIKGFNAENQEAQTFKDGVTILFQNVKKSLMGTALITSSTVLLLGIITTIIMGVGGYLMMEGTITKGDFLSFIMYLAVLVAPISQISNIGSQLVEALAGLDRTQELMEMKEENDLEVRHKKLDKIVGDIVFKEVSFAYEEGKTVLHNISFRAPAGSVTALVGSSGSGKSTIAGLVASYLNPNKGSVTIDGVDLSTIDLNNYRSYLGVVLQDDFLYEGTIRENILFPRPNATEEELLAAIKGAYVNEFTDKFEDGLDTVIGERGVKLSGGQRQRISIARALLANPKIIILDEATSNLDTESEAYIKKSLNELMKNRTTFVIAHRLSTIQQADTILVVEDGHIAERGNHEELIAAKGRYYDLYTYQGRI